MITFLVTLVVMILVQGVLELVTKNKNVWFVTGYATGTAMTLLWDWLNLRKR